MTAKVNTIKNIYMIAICGTGMGTLAGMLKSSGYNVSGSDQNVYPPMSDQLAGQGITIRQGYEPSHVPANADLVIIGNAVSRDNPEVVEVLSKGLPYQSFPQALYEFFISEKKSIVVSGTHGKTTTTALIAHALDKSGMDPSFLVGGVLQDYGASYKLGAGEYFISEGDEYDSAFFDKEPKFLHYHPQILVFGNLEFDHADIFSDFEVIKSKFLKLMELMPENGKVIAGIESEDVADVVRHSPCPVEGFALSPDVWWHAENFSYDSTSMEFDAYCGGECVARIRSSMVGQHNARNLLAAMAACREAGLAPEDFAKATESFQGVKRRQEVLGEKNQILVMDDFAHHPTAVATTLNSLKKRYPHRSLWAVFEPRSATCRRNIFQKEWVDAFLEADQAVIASLYAPQKIPVDQRLDLELLQKELIGRGTPADLPGGYDAILDHLLKGVKRGSLVVFMSSGGFGGLPKKFINSL